MASQTRTFEYVKIIPLEPEGRTSGVETPQDGTKLADVIIGKWQGGKLQTLCFAKDGSYLVDPAGITGRWRISDNQLTLDFADGKSTTTKIISLRDSELVLERKGGEERCPRVSH